MDNRGRTKREITVGDCGCRILQTTNGVLTATGMRYCPKHKAAPELYEALEALWPYIDGAANVHIDAQNKAQAALALADGSDGGG